ncbi:hypothetical protein K438DRAFT_240413 [Mycena galopus ATCC 62051]|nr:hypothetical protein K438DRAFT_240413 [Mycena galopus ATCC 62051]
MAFETLSGGASGDTRWFRRKLRNNNLKAGTICAALTQTTAQLWNILRGRANRHSPTSSILPPELEREIFVIAALSDSNTMLSLLRVARRVLEWIEPLLYRVLVIDGSPRHWAYHGAFLLKPNVIATGVRHISFIDGLWPERDFHALLRLSGPRLRSLAGSHRPELLPALSHLSQLRRWGGSLASLFGGHPAIDLSISAFRTLTHMDVWDRISADDAVICPGLAALPSLTHLCLHTVYEHLTVVVLRMLAQCLQLQVLVSMPQPTAVHFLAKNPPTTDVRFVVSYVRSNRKDWQVGARGGTDFWAAADDFVARKRRGEIEVSCFLLDHR